MNEQTHSKKPGPLLVDMAKATFFKFIPLHEYSDWFCMCMFAIFLCSNPRASSTLRLHADKLQNASLATKDVCL